MYNSPKFDGFSFSASMVPEGDVVYKDATGAAKGKYDLSGTYAKGPMVASLAYNKVDNGQEGTALGGKYNFGTFVVAASLQQVKTGAGVTATEGYTIGASTTMGQTTLTFDVAQDTKFSDTDYLLEAKYALSKRTFLYGVYVHNGSGKTTYDVNGYALGLRHNF
jgi:hypothetical protein